MKALKNLIFALAVCLFSIAAVSAQQTAAKKIYQNIEVEKFTIQPGVEYPADKIDGLTKSIYDTLIRSKRFAQVSSSDSPAAGTTATAAPAAVEKLKISGEIVKYTKGSRAMRYMVGMGAGATKIVANVKFIDVATGDVVYQQSVDGDVILGLFGGSSDDAKSGVADEIIRVMKKNGLAGEKMKK